MPTTTTGLATSFITFSRPGASGGGATVTDADGKIKWAGHNLLTNSESFDSNSWVKSLSSVAANTTPAPNSTTTADTLTALGANGWTLSNYTSAAVQYTFGVWLKRKTGTGNIQITTDDNLAWVTVSVTSDWALYTVSQTPTSGIKSAGIRVVTSGDEVYVWGAHLYRSDMQMQLNPAMPAGMQSYYPTTPRNLVGNTEDFNSWATKSGLAATPVIVNTIVAPNGLQTADKIVENSSASTHYVAQTTASLTASPYVASVYAKAAERSFVSLGFDGLNAWFNLSAGTVGTVESGLTATITAAGDGWYRCAVYRTVASAAAKTFAVYIANANNSVSYTGDGTSGIYLWGAQLSDSASLDTYVPQYGAAVTSAAYYAPRLDFDGATLSPKGLLVEELRTNIIRDANAFDVATWGKTAGGTGSAPVVTANDAIAPDGTMTAQKVSFNRGAGNTGSDISSLASTISGYAASTAYTASLYIKAAAAGDVGKQLAWRHVGEAGYGTITLTASWQRITRTETSFGTSCTIEIVSRGTITTDNTVGAHIWGAAVEVGASNAATTFATSVIPTNGATATRAADVASVSTQAFPYSASEGTIVVAANAIAPSSIANDVPLSLDQSVSADTRVSFYRATSTNVSGVYIPIAGTPQANMTGGAIVANTNFKLGAAMKENDFAFTKDGASVATDPSGSVPSVTQMTLGRTIYTASQFTGWIRQVTYLPRRISNAELISRTS